VSTTLPLSRRQTLVRAASIGISFEVLVNSVPVRVQIEDSHPHLEFWTWLIANYEHTAIFGLFGHFVK